MSKFVDYHGEKLLCNNIAREHNRFEWSHEYVNVFSFECPDQKMKLWHVNPVWDKKLNFDFPHEGDAIEYACLLLICRKIAVSSYSGTTHQ